MFDISRLEFIFNSLLLRVGLKMERWGTKLFQSRFTWQILLITCSPGRHQMSVQINQFFPEAATRSRNLTCGKLYLLTHIGMMLTRVMSLRNTHDIKGNCLLPLLRRRAVDQRVRRRHKGGRTLNAELTTWGSPLPDGESITPLSTFCLFRGLLSSSGWKSADKGGKRTFRGCAAFDFRKINMEIQWSRTTYAE